MTLDPASADALNAEASTLMKQGISAMESGGDATTALELFDRALALRRQLPLEEHPAFRFALAACLLNRSDALVRMGGIASFEEAVLSYNEGITVMRTLRLEDDAQFPRRLAIGYQNRGLALAALGRMDAAAASFESAAQVLGEAAAAAIPDRDYLTATISVNIANARAAAGTPETDAQARDAAARAIAGVRDQEAADTAFAEVGLIARHALCRILARRLSPSPGSVAMADDVHAATDAVDDALELVRQWEHKGEDRFRGLAADLIRFGARVYAVYQPQFLDEFLEDNRDPARSSPGYVDSPEIRSVVHEAAALRGR